MLTGRFAERVQGLPLLGIGVSTEYGAGDQPGALDLAAAEAALGVGFLEVGVEVDRGLDVHARTWAGRGRTTYHFLDVNLHELGDFDAAWLDGVRRTVQELRPAWLCGDAGTWHFGARERGHMLLLPPVLTGSAVAPLVRGVCRLREETGLEVLPENPPGTAFVGDLHLLDFFARVVDDADTGMLLDCAHLAIYQRLSGRDALDGLDGFPLDRVVELHVAGGSVRDHGGFQFVEDDHSPRVLDDTWRIVEHVLARAVNVKAVVVECERNAIDAVRPVFTRVREAWGARATRGPGRGVPSVGAGGPGRGVPSDGIGSPTARMEIDAVSLERVALLLHHGVDARVSLGQAERDLLDAVDARGFEVDPFRRGRVLAALLDEFPFTVAHLGQGVLDEVFTSGAFSECVLGRGSLAHSFAERVRHRSPWAELEGAIARSRRPPEGVLGAGVAAFTAPAHLPAAWAVQKPTHDDVLAGWTPPPADSPTGRFLVEAGGIVEAPDALYAVLDHARSARSLAELLSADVDQGDIQDLVDQGLLRGE